MKAIRRPRACARSTTLASIPSAVPLVPLVPNDRPAARAPTSSTRDVHVTPPQLPQAESSRFSLPCLADRHSRDGVTIIRSDVRRPTSPRPGRRCEPSLPRLSRCARTSATIKVRRRERGGTRGRAYEAAPECRRADESNGPASATMCWSSPLGWHVADDCWQLDV